MVYLSTHDKAGKRLDVLTEALGAADCVDEVGTIGFEAQLLFFENCHHFVVHDVDCQEAEVRRAQVEARFGMIRLGIDVQFVFSCMYIHSIFPLNGFTHASNPERHRGAARGRTWQLKRGYLGY